MKLPAATIGANFEVNYLSVGAITDPLDDFYGAVGRDTLKLAFKRQVTNVTDRRSVTMQVAAFGICLRYTDDFVATQFLGLWSEAGANRSRADAFVASQRRSSPLWPSTTKTTRLILWGGRTSM